MSHKATSWLSELPASAIGHGSFRVLFHLCDFHNGKRDPELACFPSQSELRERTGLSNGGLNKCLEGLEEGGFLTRKRSTVPGTSTRRTYYILGCDMDQTTPLTPQSGDSPNSTTVETAPEQTPLSGEANSTFEGGKLHPSGEEPVRNPEEEPCVSKIDPHTRFSEFWAKHPRQTKLEKTQQAFSEAIDSGVDVEWIIRAAELYAEEQKGNRAQFICTSLAWLVDERWNDFPSASRASKTSEQDQAEYWGPVIIDRLESGQLIFGLTDRIIALCLQFETITPDQAEAARRRAA